MRRESEQHPNPEPLPQEFGGSLHSIDRRLGRLAAHATQLAQDGAGTPEGLADRVYNASVADLPSASLRVTRAKSVEPGWRPRLVSGTRRDRRLIATGWGRLGLAAALGFAFVFAGLLRNGPLDEPTGQPAVELATLDIEWLDEDPLDRVDAQVAHILDTGSLSSVAEVTGELESMIASLEM